MPNGGQGPPKNVGAGVEVLILVEEQREAGRELKLGYVEVHEHGPGVARLPDRQRLRQSNGHQEDIDEAFYALDVAELNKIVDLRDGFARRTDIDARRPDTRAVGLLKEVHLIDLKAEEVSEERVGLLSCDGRGKRVFRHVPW